MSALVESLARQRLDNPAQQRSWSRCSRRPPIRCACSPRARKCRLPSPRLLANGISMSLGGSVMASQLFQFTGPVTINVTAAAAAAATTLTVDRAAPAPAADRNFARRRSSSTRITTSARNAATSRISSGWTVRCADDQFDARRHGARRQQRRSMGHPVLPLLVGDERKQTSALLGRLQRRLQHGRAQVHEDAQAIRRRRLAARSSRGARSAGHADRELRLLPPGQEDRPRPHRASRRFRVGRVDQEAEFGNSDTYHWTNCTPLSSVILRLPGRSCARRARSARTIPLATR